MTATGQNFRHYAGTSRRLIFPLRYLDGRPFEQAVTAAEWLCGVSDRTLRTDLFITKMLGTGLTVTEAGGVQSLVVDLSPTDTTPSVDGLRFGTLYHEAWIGWGAGEATLVASGSFQLRPRIGIAGTWLPSNGS